MKKIEVKKASWKYLRSLSLKFFLMSSQSWETIIYNKLNKDSVNYYLIEGRRVVEMPHE